MNNYFKEENTWEDVNNYFDISKIHVYKNKIVDSSRGLCQRVWCLNVFPLNEIENKGYGLETKFDTC